MASLRITLVFAAVSMLLYSGPVHGFFTSVQRDITITLNEGSPSTPYPVIPQVTECSGTVATLDTDGAQFSACTNVDNTCQINPGGGTATLQLVFTTISDATALGDISSLSASLDITPTDPAGNTTTVGPTTVNMNSITSLGTNKQYYIVATGYPLPKPPSDVKETVKLTISGGGKTVVCFTANIILKGSS